MERVVLSPQSTLYRTSSNSAVVTHLAPGHVLVTSVGYNDGALGPSICDEIDRVVAAQGFVQVYMDSRKVTGLAPAERDRLAKWVKAHGARYRQGHVLFHSKLIDLAVALVSLITGDKIKSHSNVAAFEKVIAANVPGFKGLPNVTALESRPSA